MLRLVETFFQNELGPVQRFDQISPRRVIWRKALGDRFETKKQSLAGLQHRFLQRGDRRIPRIVIGSGSRQPLRLGTTPPKQDDQHHRNSQGASDQYPAGRTIPGKNLHPSAPPILPP